MVQSEKVLLKVLLNDLAYCMLYCMPHGRSWGLPPLHARSSAMRLLLSLLLLASPALTGTVGADLLGVRWHHRSQLRSLANGSRAATLSSIGATVQGREIWLVQVASPGGTPTDQRPAVLVVGNLEGAHLLGSQRALETIRHLLDSADANLDDQVFYVIPRLNPDGAEAMFAEVKYDRTRSARPFDDDNDGRIDEDPGVQLTLFEKDR